MAAMNDRLFPDQRHGADGDDVAARHTGSSFVLLYCLIWANSLPVGPACKSPSYLSSSSGQTYCHHFLVVGSDRTKGKEEIAAFITKSERDSVRLLTAFIVIIESFVVSVSKVSSLFGRGGRVIRRPRN